MKRILLVGATGAFGARLARLLIGWPDVELVLAARRQAPLDALVEELQRGTDAVVTSLAFDRAAPHALARLSPWALVDASGPFQGGDVALARAAIAAGAHYIDIADARDFVATFAPALEAEARRAGVLAVTGASSTPALSNAALDELTRGWRVVDSVTVAISPGARAPRGRSVIQAILSYVGRPVRLFTEGRWTHKPGWSGLRRLWVPNLGRRLVSLCETPDLDIIPARLSVRTSATFLAGLELASLHLGLWLLSWPVRLGLVRDLVPLAGSLGAVAGLFAAIGSDRGGMIVLAEGRGADGERRVARWSLAAAANAGPTTPVAAAAAVLRALMEGRLTVSGAYACVGLVTLDEIVAELEGLPITTEQLTIRPDEPVLFRRVLGDRFTRLPRAVHRIHGAASGGRFRGRGRARGARNPAARSLRTLMGLPAPGAYPELEVTISAQQPGSERWVRTFGAGRFSSRLVAAKDPGVFEEQVGPISFAFGVETRPQGFVWRFIGWRLGPAPLPAVWAPRIRARAFEADGGYRFRVTVAHRWLGVIFAYAGRLH